jgi:hypothetical protein
MIHSSLSIFSFKANNIRFSDTIRRGLWIHNVLADIRTGMFWYIRDFVKQDQGEV